MSSRYQKGFTIPDGFPQILKSFTREILRSQPDNMYQFGAEYFEGKITENAKEHARQKRAVHDSDANDAPRAPGGDADDARAHAAVGV